MTTSFESIQPEDFQSPDQLPPQKRRPLKLVYFIAVVAVLFIGFILYFTLSAKAVLFRINADNADIDISGGFSFPIGESRLLLHGEYLVTVTAPGFLPFSENLDVSSNTPTEISYELTPLPGNLQVTIVADEEVKGSAELSGPNLENVLEIEAPDVLFFADLPSGTYQLRVDANLYSEKMVEVLVPGENRTHEVTVSLEPNWGWLKVSTSPELANFSVDGEPINSVDSDTTDGVSQARMRIEAGARDFLAELPDYKPVAQDILLTSGQEIDLGLIQLEHVDSKISINTEPANVSVLVNQNYAGETPLTLDLLPDMEHQIELFKAGFKSRSERIAVERNSEKNLNYELEPDLVQISLSLYPQNSTLKINGNSISKTSGQLSLPAIKHQVEVSAPGYESQQIEFLPVRGTRQHLQVRLLTTQDALWAKIPPGYKTIVGQEMKLFRDPGTALMGSSRRETGRRANEASWEATLERPFYVSLTEVSNQQYKVFVPEHSSGNFEGNSLDSANQPVVNITWQQAALYCNWLSEKEGLQPFYTVERGYVSGNNPQATGYRLLTETEWTWLTVMTPSGLSQKYLWGDSETIPGAVENYADQSVSALINFTLESVNDSYITTAPVGSFPANDKGIYDLSGNVNEWMHDWYDAAPYDPGEPVTDPLGPEEGEFHVIRGASWARGYLPQLRLAYRDYDSTERNDLGFRVARYAM